jgi:hypothetical protein
MRREWPEGHSFTLRDGSQTELRGPKGLIRDLRPTKSKAISELAGGPRFPSGFDAEVLKNRGEWRLVEKVAPESNFRVDRKRKFGQAFDLTGGLSAP